MKKNTLENQRSDGAWFGCSVGVFLIGALVLTTAFSAVILRTSLVSADDVIDDVSITIPVSCSMSGNIDTAHTASMQPDSYSAATGSDYENGIGKTTLTTFCNDQNGFSIYAIGYTGNVDGDNTLVGTATSSYATIATGTNTSGGTSNWAMKVNKVENPSGGSPVTYNPENMTIVNSFNNYHAVPSDYMKVAEYHAQSGSSATDMGPTALGAKITTTYAAFISATQAADTYTGQVKYVMVHPYDAAAPEIPVPTLYDNVASMSKGKQTAAQLRTTITVPTSADRTQDTSNSGVYEYDPSVFGTSSDASNDNKIYYYRGVLENSVGSYGSDGSAVTYPNYVVLSSAANSSGLTTSDTCWRIVRTTGSGGVKIVYNGLYGATIAGSCANTETNAQVATSAYNGTSSTFQRIALVGYTYNPTYGDANVTTSTSVDDVFGNNSNYSANSSNSTIKGYIENTWFSNISAYEGILEPSAGYCNDRTAYSDNTTSTALSTIVPYATSNALMYFGAVGRNAYATNAGKAPSLTCPSNRNVVDLYTASSASNGNKQLTKPAALLTADEVSLAGSGSSAASQGSAYHANSFLRSGSYFWLLSPYNRSSSGPAGEFYLYSGGSLGNYVVSGTIGVRPAISLTSGTTAVSGSGTATDPWIVNPPSS